MIWLYRGLFLPALACVLPYYGWRMWRRGGYRRDFAHRLGWLRNVPPRQSGVKRIWLQAVSVGELLALDPVLRRLAERPEVEVFLTTTTSTGRAEMEKRYAALCAWRGIFPLDFQPFTAGAWRRIDPDLVVLMESELWPEHLHQAARRKVPVILANARMSDRSARRYERFRWFARPLLAPLSQILAVSEGDRERFAALGLGAPVEVMGNLKFDFDPEPVLARDQIDALRAELGLGTTDLLLVGASTWPGEERLLASLVARFRAEGLPVRALLVPRHAERRAEIERELADLPLRTHFRTRGAAAPDSVELYLGDTTGELRRFLQLADLVFVGKSLPPHTQGQTPIEAAAYKKSIVFGHGMSNFGMITTDLLQAGAATAVSPDSLEEVLRERLTHAARRASEGAAARAVFLRHRGAAERLLASLDVRLRACGHKNETTY